MVKKKDRETDPSLLLGEATFEELFVEIASRTDYAVIGAVSGVGTHEENFRMLYAGGRFAAVGVAKAIQNELEKEFLEADEMENPEDKP